MFDPIYPSRMTASERAELARITRDAGRGLFWMTVRTALREVRAAFRDMPAAVKVFLVAVVAVLVLLSVGLVGGSLAPTDDLNAQSAWDGFQLAAMSMSAALPIMLAVMAHGAYRDRMRRLLARDYLRQIDYYRRLGSAVPPQWGDTGS
jgi:hypothetical protein